MDVTDRFAESDLLPLSALQHLAFCRRQCALIHIEGIWEENRLTAEGRLMHDRADQEDVEVRGDVRIAHAVRLRSLRLGLAGKADVIEFHRAETSAADGGACVLPGVDGLWKPFPVEYKRGKPKVDDCDKVQVCAQALCLEEMLGAPIPAAAIYYGRPRRRLDVLLDSALRNETEALVRELHALINAGRTPTAQYAPRCENCSLKDRCMPDLACKEHRVELYVSRVIDDALKGPP